jgi:hypothetical protein
MINRSQDVYSPMESVKLYDYRRFQWRNGNSEPKLYGINESTNKDIFITNVWYDLYDIIQCSMRNTNTSKWNEYKTLQWLDDSNDKLKPDK